ICLESRTRERKRLDCARRHHVRGRHAWDGGARGMAVGGPGPHATGNAMWPADAAALQSIIAALHDRPLALLLGLFGGWGGTHSTVGPEWFEAMLGRACVAAPARRASDVATQLILAAARSVARDDLTAFHQAIALALLGLAEPEEADASGSLASLT